MSTDEERTDQVPALFEQLSSLTGVPAFSQTKQRYRRSYPNSDDDWRKDSPTSTELAQIVGPRVQSFQNGGDEEVSLLEKFEGVVTDVNDEDFRARFGRAGIDDVFEAEFLREELGEEDNAILGPGMGLVWSIVRERLKGGIRRSSILYVRRIPPPDREDVDAAVSMLNEWVGN